MQTRFAICVLFSLIAGTVSLRIIDTEIDEPEISDELFWKQDEVVVPLVTGAGRGGTHSAHNFLIKNGIKAVHEGIAPRAVSVSWLYAAFGDRAYSKQEIEAPFSHVRVAHRNRWFNEWQPYLSEASEGTSPELFSMANLYVGDEDIKLRFHPIVHLVRDPLKSIASLARCFCGNGNMTMPESPHYDEESWKFADRFANITSRAGTDRMKMAAHYWMSWHWLLKRSATHTFRVENMDGKELLEALGYNKQVEHDFQGSKGGESPWELKHDLTWDSLREAVGSEVTNVIKNEAKYFGYNYAD